MKRTVSGTVKVTKSKQITSKSIVKSLETNNLVKKFEKKRLETAKSILEFNFVKKRVRILSKITEVKENSNGIVYWMSRECRVQDNWALLFAQKLALKNSLPLYICFCLVPKYLEATIRHFKFMLKGLKEVEDDCKNLNINFNLLIGLASEQIPKFVRTNKIGAVVCDFSPLRISTQWIKDVEMNLPSDVPLCQVDGHNIVPVWVVSDKQEYAARTIRNKINEKLKTFLTEFPPVIKNPFGNSKLSKVIDWNEAYESLLCNMAIDEVEWAQPGYRMACKELEEFCEKRLKFYNDKRNDPLAHVISNLSPWFHFGQISVQRCVLEVKEFKSQYPESVAAFCEEAIIRRELSDNFCFYNENYDSLKGLAPWAYKTLDEHRKDKRIHLYTKEELESSKTYDDLWNSAQIQLVKEGKMHGFLRMYWAKKILEWTKSPEDALKIAIYLNDKYSLDGRDPNGYVGCMWSIGGIHDQGWKERPIFGKIRYMNYEGCRRKFDVKAFVKKYDGKVISKK